MMGATDKSINVLFDQLGLDSSDEAIDQFVLEHQLGKDEKLVDAPFWSDNQRKFLKEEYRMDAGWVEFIDDLNVRLHKDAHA